jgi:hypothetical protein
LVVSSADGGRTWTKPRSAVQGIDAGSFPGLAVDACGRVGFAYTDQRDDDLRDVWFAESRDRGVTWSRQHVAGPFSLDVLGFFQETAALRRGFGAVFAAGPPLGAAPGEVMFARQGTPCGR